MLALMVDGQSVAAALLQVGKRHIACRTTSLCMLVYRCILSCGTKGPDRVKRLEWGKAWLLRGICQGSPQRGQCTSHQRFQVHVCASHSCEAAVCPASSSRDPHGLLRSRKARAGLLKLEQASYHTSHSSKVAGYSKTAFPKSTEVSIYYDPRADLLIFSSSRTTKSPHLHAASKQA